jgi:Ni,Fe-hydrogenase III large subunit
LFQLPSALSRFERTGVVSYEDVLSIGTVGMAARMSGLNRDIRSSHPFSLYSEMKHEPIIKHHGDVYSRVQIRRQEIKQSMQYIRELIQNVPEISENEPIFKNLKPNSFTLSLVEGWRGEICHCAITDQQGELAHYKVKDPSFHNWLALALAVRNNEISDFPICNKSFNLSYSGHDL